MALDRAKTTHKPYRLLTESEWEYAARAGTTSFRYWGDDKNDGCAYANVYDLDALKGLSQNPPNPDRYTVCHDGHVRSAPVGSFKPNAFGLHDMIGNVFEWLEDCFHENYEGAPSDGSAWIAGACEQRAARGGSWSSAPRNLRSAWRERDRPDFRYDGIGFRVGLTIQK